MKARVAKSEKTQRISFLAKFSFSRISRFVLYPRWTCQQPPSFRCQLAQWSHAFSWSLRSRLLLRTFGLLSLAGTEHSASGIPCFFSSALRFSSALSFSSAAAFAAAAFAAAIASAFSFAASSALDFDSLKIRSNGSDAVLKFDETTFAA